MPLNFWTCLATFFGVGRIKKLPGTAASFVALVFLLDHSTLALQSVLIFLIFFAGVKASNVMINTTGKIDPAEVVIDEVCGILVTFYLVPINWVTVVIGFVLFRFFDIVKPFPVCQFETLPRGWGVMADDVVAGLLSNLILQVLTHTILK